MSIVSSDSLCSFHNGTTYYYYERWSLIEEAAAGSASCYYVHGARVDEVVKQLIQYNPAPRFFHYDARGHCTLQTSASGNIAEQYEYDAFGYPYFYDASGAPMTVNGQPGSAWGNRFLFTGREWLADLKLYDFRNRMYQPELGRFFQPDPKEFAAGDYNLYRYCHNDPVNKTDPTGLYGRGEDFKDDRQWRKFNEAQKVAANNIAFRLDHMDKGRFEAVFGKGSATAENMGKVEKSLRGMLAALRDDGSGGHFANIARLDLNSGALAKGVQNGMEMFVHVENPFFNVLSKLANAIGHEAGHNVGLVHGVGPNGTTAYRYGEPPQQSAYRNLPTADRLTNPDHVMAFTE